MKFVLKTTATGPVRVSAAEFAKNTAAVKVAGGKSKGKSGIRLPKMGPNENEKRLAEIVRQEWPGHRVEHEALSFRLPSGTYYTPDLVVFGKGNVVTGKGNRGMTVVACYEAKGAHRLGSAAASAEKFKAARAEYKGVRWIFAKWDKQAGGYVYDE